MKAFLDWAYSLVVVSMNTEHKRLLLMPSTLLKTEAFTALAISLSVLRMNSPSAYDFAQVRRIISESISPDVSSQPRPQRLLSLQGIRTVCALAGCSCSA